MYCATVVVFYIHVFFLVFVLSSLNNSDVWHQSQTPIMKLIKTSHCNKEWINLLDSFGDVLELAQVGVKLDLSKKDHLGLTVFDQCKDDPSKLEWQNMLQEIVEKQKDQTRSKK